MLCRDVGRRIRAAKDTALPFRKMGSFLEAADLTFVNLESPFADKGPKGESGLVFRAKPETIDGLVLAGVDVASTANNHARDSFDHGVSYTISWLRQHHIEPVGSGVTQEAAHEGVILERHGVRFGFLGYTYDQKNGNWRDLDPRIAVMDAAVMEKDVAALRKRSDVVIVSMHAGLEYWKKTAPYQVDFARKAIDAGASLVIGHHPHVIQEMERYRGGAIYYSLGNFVFDQFQRTATQHGEIAEVIFSGRDIAEANSIPIRIKHDGPEIEPPPTPPKKSP